MTGEKSVLRSGSYKRTYCTSRSPFTWSSQYYKIEVELKGYYSSSFDRRGFVIGYVQYKDG